MTMRATGTFEVQMRPQSEPDEASGTELGSLSLEKRFYGELDGVGKGAMLTAMTAVDGSAGYVAIERVTGTLNGRQGSFVFQHTGIMNRGVQQLSITVVPDSGSGQLSGLSGEFSLEIVNGQHVYTFDYTLPE